MREDEFIMPTALELTREEWQPYLDAAAKRQPLPTASLEEQAARERLIRRIQKAAELLKERFNARRVILFGSLAHRGWFVADSDVDLVVEGLTADDYWQAWRQVEDIVKERPVDLIEIEAVTPSLLQSIQRYGIEL